METAMTFFHFPGSASTACSSPARRLATTFFVVVVVVGDLMEGPC